MNAKKILKQLKQAEEAVSPVVATLLLVLVAAGGAIGVGIFMGNFQDKTQKNVGTDAGGDALTIGGSSTVFPVTKMATDLYAANHPGVSFELSQGGSTLGLKGVGTGALDIGARSKALTATDREKYPDLDADGVRDYGLELVEHLIGYDGVVVTYAASNCLSSVTGHSAATFTQAEMKAIYGLNGESAAGTTTVRTGSTGTDVWINGGAGDVANVASTVTWKELQAYLEIRDAAAAGSYGTCDTDAAFDVAIKLYDRADKGGTSEVFCETMLGQSGAASDTLCDTEKQITLTTLPKVNEREGNALVETGVAGDRFGIGFSSYGTVKLNHATDLVIAGFDKDNLAFGKEFVVSPTPTQDWVANIKDGDYDGARSLFYVTIGEPTGLAAEFIAFVKNPENNAGIMKEIGYVSLY